MKNNVSEQNFANYREFSTTKIDDFKTNFKDVETRITVETRNVADEIQRIQLKAVGVDETGKIRIQDYTTAKMVYPLNAKIFWIIYQNMAVLS